MLTAIDTNVLSAILAAEPTAVSIARFLHEARNDGGLVLAPVAFCELLAHPKANETLIQSFLHDTEIFVDFSLPQAVWTEAGRRFARYARRRRAGHGHPKRMLADFLIGAHALLQADRLMTLDTRIYKHDFPDLKLMCP